MSSDPAADAMDVAVEEELERIRQDMERMRENIEERLDDLDVEVGRIKDALDMT